MTDQGYLYVALGNQFVKEAIHSGRSLRKVDPNAHITLITTTELNGDHPFDQTHLLAPPEREHPKNGYLYKIMGILATPYSKTLFLDSDTYFCDSCLELFDFLDHFDLCLSHCNVDTSPCSTLERKVLKGYFPYNTGVIAFNKSAAVDSLFRDWLVIFSEKMDEFIHDQPAFMEAYLSNRVPLYIFHQIYNVRLPYIVALIAKPAKILHGRYMNYEKVKRKLNAKIKHRVWVGPCQQVIYFKKPVWVRIYQFFPKHVQFGIKRVYYLIFKGMLLDSRKNKEKY